MRMGGGGGAAGAAAVGVGAAPPIHTLGVRLLLALSCCVGGFPGAPPCCFDPAAAGPLPMEMLTAATAPTDALFWPTKEPASQLWTPAIFPPSKSSTSSSTWQCSPAPDDAPLLPWNSPVSRPNIVAARARGGSGGQSRRAWAAEARMRSNWRAHLLPQHRGRCCGVVALLLCWPSPSCMGSSSTTALVAPTAHTSTMLLQNYTSLRGCSSRQAPSARTRRAVFAKATRGATHSRRASSPVHSAQMHRSPAPVLILARAPGSCALAPHPPGQPAPRPRSLHTQGRWSIGWCQQQQQQHAEVSQCGQELGEGRQDTRPTSVRRVARPPCDRANA